MSAWLYLLIPVAIVGGIFLGIRFGTQAADGSSGRFLVLWLWAAPTRTVRDILAATATQGEMVVVVAEID